MNGNEFDKLLSIQEKSIVAWDRTFNKLEKLNDEIERLRMALEKKIDNDERFAKWLKFATSFLIAIGGIIGIILSVMEITK